MNDTTNDQAALAAEAAAALLAFAQGLAALAELPGEEGLAAAKAHFARGKTIADRLGAAPAPTIQGRAEIVINFNGACCLRDPRAVGEALSRAIKSGGTPITPRSLG